MTMPAPKMVGLFGLPTEEGMKKKMASAADDLKAHVTSELRVPKLLVSVAAVAFILWLWERR
jgi:hypothetical protein